MDCERFTFFVSSICCFQQIEFDGRRKEFVHYDMHR